MYMTVVMRMTPRTTTARNRGIVNARNLSGVASVVVKKEQGMRAADLGGGLGNLAEVK